MADNITNGRTLTATIEVTYGPRDVALLAMASQGKTQGDAADFVGVHRQTVVQSINRLYAKLGVEKQGAAIGKALASGVMRSDDLTLSDDTLRSLFAAGDDWGAVGTTAAPDKPEPKGPPVVPPAKKKRQRKNGPVTSRQATPAERDQQRAEVAASRRKARQAG